MKRKAKKIHQKKSIKNTFTDFKYVIESKLGKINWRKVGIYTMALLLVTAYFGFLGPKAKLLSALIINYTVAV